MGALIEERTARRITLSSRCLLGRHRACDVHTDAPRVSGEHASLHWMGDRWELRDLGSRNGTFVEERRLASGERVNLAEGAHYLLVVLARARLADHGAPEAARGWVDRGELCSMLAVDPNRLGVDIFRVRKQMGELGILGAADIVVRRAGTGQVRIGTGRVEIVTL